MLLLGLNSLRITIVSLFFLPSLRLFDKCSKSSLDTTRVGLINCHLCAYVLMAEWCSFWGWRGTGPA